jgi:hypothetical protein
MCQIMNKTNDGLHTIDSNDPALAYHLKGRLADLCNICNLWRAKNEHLPTDGSWVPVWGPTLAKLQAARDAGTWWRFDNRDSEEPSCNVEERELVSSDDEEEVPMEEEAEEDEWVLEVLAVSIRLL